MSKITGILRRGMLVLAAGSLLTACTIPGLLGQNQKPDLAAETISAVQNQAEEESTAAISATTEITAEDSASLGDLVAEIGQPEEFVLADVPDYRLASSTKINGNKPYFTDQEMTEIREALSSAPEGETSVKDFTDLDSLGRCGRAIACIGPEMLATEPRGEIGMVKPTGWQTVKYHGIVGNYLYNRCHLIAYSLSGENANEKNLITGTRDMNTEGMQPYELEVLDYVRSTGRHVLYRVTPIFNGDNLLASGVLMEAQSIEDKGRAVNFNVYCYNVQPGVTINYADGSSEGPEYTGSDSREVSEEDVSAVSSGVDENTGNVDNMPESESKSENLSDAAGAFVITGGNESSGDRMSPEEDTAEIDASDTNTSESTIETDYVLNTNTMKFHYPSCKSVDDIKDKNRKDFHGSREEAIEQGYDACKRCKP